MNGNSHSTNLAPRSSPPLPLDVGSVHSVEDLKEIFEPRRRRRFGRKIPTDIVFPRAISAEPERTKCSWLSQHGNDTRQMVKEKVKMFEDGYFDHAWSYTKRGMSMDDLFFVGNSVRRQRNLLEKTTAAKSSISDPHEPTPRRRGHFCQSRFSSKTKTGSSHSSTAVDDWEGLCPESSEESFCHFSRHRKRASTGRLLFEEYPSVWKLTDSLATQVCEVPISVDNNGVEETSNHSQENTPPNTNCLVHKRRHSTGCIGNVNVCTETATTTFWQVYHQENNTSFSQDLTRAEYRRTVRFHQHVTVWTFAKERQPRKRRRRRKDYRFERRGEHLLLDTAPPSMPRRQDTNHGDYTHNTSVILPQTSCHFSLPRSAVPSTCHSPPLQPKRRPSMDPDQIPRHDSSSSWGTTSVASFANHTEGMREGHSMQSSQEQPTRAAVSPPPADHHVDNDTVRQRRKRALQWFHRWALPDRETMKKMVQQTPGLDITVDDVDLLPWDEATYRRTGWARLSNADPT